MSTFQALNSTFAQAESSAEPANSVVVRLPAIFGRVPTEASLRRRLAEMKHKFEPIAPSAIELTDIGPASSSRPSMKQLIDPVTAGRISAVYVADLPRLHSDDQAIAEFMQQAERVNCPIVAADAAQNTGLKART